MSTIRSFLLVTACTLPCLVQAPVAAQSRNAGQGIAVASASTYVSERELAARVGDLVRQHNGGRPVEVVFHGTDNDFTLPGAASRWKLDGFAYDTRSGRFSAQVNSYGAADAIKVSGRAHSVESLPMLRSRVMPGEVITREHIEWRQVASGRYGSEYVDRIDDIVGLTPKRALGIGQPIRSHDLARSETITKNSLVTMVAEAPGLTITTSGRAVEGGALGDVIQVMNLQSKKTVQGTIIAPGQVRVVMATRLIASN